MLTPNDVRKLALALPGAEEQDHLSLEEQDAFVRMQPAVFAVTPWGHQGWTSVELARVDRAL
ncbi:hypothetical protein [Archangium sp.]|uniref:hypothetical protein n=1 Tax=Archangium sp. TaxID=1872627 RepID=UPI002ED7D4A2